MANNREQLIEHALDMGLTMDEAERYAYIMTHTDESLNESAEIDPKIVEEDDFVSLMFDLERAGQLQ